MKKEKHMTDWLAQFRADTVCAGLAMRALDERGVELTGGIREFLELLQVPEVYSSMFARLSEVKAIFRSEIDAFREPPVA